MSPRKMMKIEFGGKQMQGAALLFNLEGLIGQLSHLQSANKHDPKATARLKDAQLGLQAALISMARFVSKDQTGDALGHHSSRGRSSHGTGRQGQRRESPDGELTRKR